ncbi:MAG: alpha/beta fold hydrolase [Sinobacteraceae bacterium]|nr:alpha/beta fold hydrolase [Nevskiaceae bacterium]MCP5470713.1 alpha/beta fold hydrolase [Nevskiaceae bacterium]
MNPYFFGSTNRRLFGVHLVGRAHGKRGNARAVVLCPPWGQEYLRAHRSLRRLGDLIAAEGCDVLRFDYFGTGDSGGDGSDASLRGWESDIDTAIDELKDIAGVGRVALVGLRLGATLAARVAERRNREVSALVLWDPIVSGQAYVEELLEAARMREHAAERPIQRELQSGGGYELLGFSLPDAMLRELAQLRLAPSDVGWVCKTHCVVSQGPEAEAQLRSLAEHPKAAATFAAIPGRPPWIEADQIMTGEVPVALLHHVAKVLVDGTHR